MPAWFALTLAAFAASDAPPPPPQALTTADVIKNSTPSDWRSPDPNDTLYLDLAKGGRVVIELAPSFAPKHAANIRTLAHEHYFDGLAILRSQDNYVVQWGDPNAEPRAGEPDAKPKSFGTAKDKIDPEFTRPWSKDLAFTKLPDGDVYAPEVGYSNGFPAARDTKAGLAWMAHCYGMVGVGRGNELDSGSGAELYVVIGHSPRHLDRNIALVGRVLQGMEYLSVLPRGSGPLGFYAGEEKNVPIKSVRLAADVPEAQREKIEVLRTDTDTFRKLVEARRNRREDWFKFAVGHVELCNVPIPVRPKT